MQAFETSATLEDLEHLTLDRPMPPAAGQRVKVIVLFPDDDLDDESAWLASASRSGAFADLAEPAEDVYTADDGKVFHDAG
jgi:hypothetical protein